jgi:hypothetical protein
MRNGKRASIAHEPTRKAHAQSDLAAAGARYDAETAFAEAKGASDRLAAAGEGEKAGRAWVASVLQGEAVGAVDAKDLADSYIAWFQMRARWATAVQTMWSIRRTAPPVNSGGPFRRMMIE